MLKKMIFPVSFCLMMIAVGCSTASDPSVSHGDPLGTLPAADAGRSSEVQLIETMATQRAGYEQALRRLYDFYDQQGNQLKAEWAADELDYFLAGPRRAYLVVAEMAGPDLTASQSIAQADELFAQGMAYYDEGKSDFIILADKLADEDDLNQAMATFNALINSYPTSDKIDDAAFWMGEIQRRFMKNYPLALLCYQRCLQWDPQTTAPVRYATALIYDECLHDRTRAIEYYQESIDHEAMYPEHIDHANRRLVQLNTDPTGASE